MAEAVGCLPSVNGEATPVAGNTAAGKGFSRHPTNKMIRLPFFLARKIYADGDSRRQVSRPAIRIATIGVAVGLAVMMISVGVVIGFKHSIRNKVVGFAGNFIVSNFMTLQGFEPRPVAMPDSMMKAVGGIEGVKHVQRYAYKQGILKTDNDFLGVLFKGVDEGFDAGFMQENLKEGEIPGFSSRASGNRILVSRTMADRLRVKTGDKIFAYFVKGDDVRTRRFTIAGVYETNLKMFDESTCLTDLYTVSRLNGWDEDQVSGAEVTVTRADDEDVTEQALVDKVNKTLDRNGETFSTLSARKMYPQIFVWIDLLDLNVWVILGLMMAVAAVTMISGLLIIILERTSMIGILKALGARNDTVRHTFMWFAVFVLGKGLLLGNIIGVGLCLLQQYTGIVKLDPANYYVSEVPVELSWWWIALLNAATFAVCVFVLIAPGYLVSHIHPAKSMRYE